jgi:hypothetical protein
MKIAPRQGSIGGICFTNESESNFPTILQDYNSLLTLTISNQRLNAGFQVLFLAKLLFIYLFFWNDDGDFLKE